MAFKRWWTGPDLLAALAVTQWPILVMRFDYKPFDKILPTQALALIKAGPYEGFVKGGVVRKIRPLDPGLAVSPKVAVPSLATSWCAPIETAAVAIERREADRRRRESEAVGVHSESEWQALLEKFGHRCLRCEIPEDLSVAGGRLTKDHVVPLASDGTDFISNIQPLCRSCNSWKGNREIDFRTRNAERAA